MKPVIAVLIIAGAATAATANPGQQARWATPPVDCKPTLAFHQQEDRARVMFASETAASRDQRREKPREQRQRSTKPCIQLASA